MAIVCAIAGSTARPSALVALRFAVVGEALDRAHDVAGVESDRGDLAGRGTRRERLDRALERIDRRLHRTGLGREVALGGADQRRRVTLDRRELRGQTADPAAGDGARQILDRVLEIRAIRAISRL